MVEINESERKKEKRIKRNEDNLRDLQDNIKRSNIRIIGVPEEEDKKKDDDKILKEIIVENFLKMGKEIITQVQETQRVPNRINPRRNTPRHIPELFHLVNLKFSQMVKRLPTVWETWVRSLGQEDSLEKEMATHSSTLAWKIPWTEEHSMLQSMGLQRVGHD